MPGKRSRKASKQARLEDFSCFQDDIPDRLRERQPPREDHFSDDSSDNLSKIKIQDAKKPNQSPSTSRKKTGVMVLSSGAESSDALQDPEPTEPDPIQSLRSPTSSSSSSSASMESEPQRKRRRIVDNPSRPQAKVKRSKSGKPRVLSSSSSSQSSSPVPPKRQSLSEPQSSSESAAESSNENEDLMDEVDSEKIVEQKFRARVPKQSAFSRSLELLRKRQGKRKGSSPSEQHDEESESESESSSGSNSSEPFEGAVPPGESVPSGESSDDTRDSFVVEDDGDADIPIEFGMARHQDLSVHFKNVCLYFVYLATYEHSKRRGLIKRMKKDREFSLAMSVLHRKLSGFRDSLVISSVWTSEFKTTLDTYPLCTNEPMRISIPMCDACHIGGRVATISTRLSGKPYDRETFGEVQIRESSESDEDPQRNGVNFSLGRFCARRATVYHSFSHWEYELFSVIQSEVDDLQRPADSRGDRFVRVNWGHSSEIPEDVEDPVQIMEWLDHRGIINYEYSKIKKLMESARSLNIQGRDEDITFLG